MHSFFYAWAGNFASKKAYKKMLATVIRASSTFFRDNTLSEITLRFVHFPLLSRQFILPHSRFYKDTEKLDTTFSKEFSKFFIQWGKVCVTFGLMFVTNWMFIFVVLAVLPFYFICFQFNLAITEQMNWLGIKSKSPFTAHIRATLAGLESIRCFRLGKKFSR